LFLGLNMDQAFYETVARQEEYMESLKSVREYAEQVGMSDRQIRRQCESGKLLAFKIGSQWAVAGKRLEGENK
jgi:hypothetical protein